MFICKEMDPGERRWMHEGRRVNHRNEVVEKGRDLGKNGQISLSIQREDGKCGYRCGEACRPDGGNM